MPTYDLIKTAIQNKQAITANYDGLPRELCPHVIGTKNGTEQCLCYQFGGETSRGKITTDGPSNWKCMVISKFKNVAISDGEWHTYENHSKKQTCVDIIDAEIDY
jgi:hypothetical protein